MTPLAGPASLLAMNILAVLRVVGALLLWTSAAMIPSVILS